VPEHDHQRTAAVAELDRQALQDLGAMARAQDVDPPRIAADIGSSATDEHVA
jgi:hypothetical protein